MKKTLIAGLPFEASEELLHFVKGAKIYDSSSSPEARVYFLERDSGYYLKTSAPGELCREAEMAKYFYKKGLAPEPILYLSGERDVFLTRKAIGEDCTHDRYLSEPKRLCDLLAEELRKLHELDFSLCPVPDRTAEYIASVNKDYNDGRFDSDFLGGKIKTREEAYSVFSEGAGELRCDVLLHGDYCLPNVILDTWRFSSFIDLGCGGVGDRHIDVYWGIWTLHFNLKTDKYTERFIDAYGKDKISREILRVIASAESLH